MASRCATGSTSSPTKKRKTASRARASASSCCRTSSAIAEALAYAHERRVVHRDVTPNNIILGKRGEATLIDWGIARDLDAPGGSEASIHDGNRRR